jgi:hypothetical protein
MSWDSLRALLLDQYIIAHRSDKSILITGQFIVQTFGVGINFRRRRDRTQ